MIQNTKDIHNTDNIFWVVALNGNSSCAPGWGPFRVVWAWGYLLRMVASINGVPSSHEDPHHPSRLYHEQHDAVEEKPSHTSQSRCVRKHFCSGMLNWDTIPISNTCIYKTILAMDIIAIRISHENQCTCLKHGCPAPAMPHSFEKVGCIRATIGTAIE